MTVWAEIRHNGESTYACCSSVENGKQCDCKHYNPDNLCRNCEWVKGKVIDREEEEE